MRLVGRPLLDAFPNRILNIHPSLLPSFPGLDAQRQALAHGVRVTGATVHLVNAELDAGPIVLQAAVPVLDTDQVETLSARVLVEEHRLYPEAIALVLDGGWSIDGRRLVAHGGVVSGWTEQDSQLYRDIADVAVPGRQELMATLVAAVPFAAEEPVKILELGSGDGRLAEALLTVFPRATLTALDGSESMRRETAARLAPFGDRARVAAFEVAALDWWDRMFGVDLIVSSLCLHHLNDAKKQYLYKAAAERLSVRGVLLIADLIDPQHPALRRLAADQWDAQAKAQADRLASPALFQRFIDARWNHFRFPDADDQPSALFHHLVWLRHAGFPSVDCCWLNAGHAVFGGFKQVAGSAPRPPAGN